MLPAKSTSHPLEFPKTKTSDRQQDGTLITDSWRLSFGILHARHTARYKHKTLTRAAQKTFLLLNKTSSSALSIANQREGKKSYIVHIVHCTYHSKKFQTDTPLSGDPAKQTCLSLSLVSNCPPSFLASLPVSLSLPPSCFTLLLWLGAAGTATASRLLILPFVKGIFFSTQERKRKQSSQSTRHSQGS